MCVYAKNCKENKVWGSVTESLFDVLLRVFFDFGHSAIFEMVRLRPDELNRVVLGYCFIDIGVSSINIESVNKASRHDSSPIYRLRIAQFVQVRIDRITAKYFSDSTYDEQSFVRNHRNHIVDVPGDEVLGSLIRALRGEFDSGADCHSFSALYA